MDCDKFKIVTEPNNKNNLVEMQHNEIKEHTVDNAIIMAAGFGSRFVPLSYEKPKGLVEVLGESMVERQIKQLLEVSITDITIVVGYLKEKFEYLVEKYGVKLICNPEYDTKNNLSTIYHVRHLLRNTYILSSDNYITKNLFSTVEHRSWYSAIKAEGHTEEWCLFTDEKDRIKKIEVGGYNQWHMYGPVYFSKEFSSSIVPLVESTYEKVGSEDFYWEDVLKDNIDKLEIFINPQLQDVIYEFENLEELREFDCLYKKESNSKIMKIIAKVFNVKEGSITKIKPLKSKDDKNSFTFEIKDKNYRCIISEETMKNIIRNDKEFNKFEGYSSSKINNKIVYKDSYSGIEILEL
ncbi:sugar phosphate nucleotidyltransferase [Clostridium grantii]|uniref:CTP:phosphocholine cytidylyltransferase n=1 Tax=Clostridium grantii DSM 8605 TaxID=1121316 RepID=A0A1M5RKE1_9CLOT|nr:sugar phosphate nucleotidyltransferase [Clostridium grantii]SHH26715.1 CTP:phosphocholine cytidylyltransferase [Clostridium grantii DSM 8605]